MEPMPRQQQRQHQGAYAHSRGTLFVVARSSLLPGSSNTPHPSGARRPPRACGLDYRAEGVQVCRGPPRRGEIRPTKGFQFLRKREGDERGCDAHGRGVALMKLWVESTRCRRVCATCCLWHAEPLVRLRVAVPRCASPLVAVLEVVLLRFMYY